MATFRKRGDSWQVQIRRVGHPAISRSFTTKDDAVRWARLEERALDGREAIIKPTVVPSLQIGDDLRVEDLLTRYEREITVTKRGADREVHKLRVIRQHPISQLNLSDLKRCHVIGYRNDRLKSVKQATVKREIAIIRHCFEIASSEWSLQINKNPARQIRFSGSDVSRQRRLSPQEYGRFIDALEAGKWFLKPIVCLALETGMRRGEIFSLRRQDIDFSRNVLSIRETKNGTPRSIPLSPSARRVLKNIDCLDVLLQVNLSTFREAWLNILSRADIKDFRFHDLRHEAISRFFEMGLSVPEVALISGHKDVRMLFRYTHIRPENVARKLADIDEKRLSQDSK